MLCLTTPELNIVKMDVGGDDGRGKQPAEEEADESSDNVHNE